MTLVGIAAITLAAWFLLVDSSALPGLREYRARHSDGSTIALQLELSWISASHGSFSFASRQADVLVVFGYMSWDPWACELEARGEERRASTGARILTITGCPGHAQFRGRLGDGEGIELSLPRVR